MSLHITVDDSSLPHWENDVDALIPRVYRLHDPHSDPAIQLIDVMEMWTGLRGTKAAELRFWHNALRASIQRYVHDALVSNLKDAGVHADAGEIHQHILSLGYQQITCDVDWLLEDMLKQQRQKQIPCAWWSWDLRIAITNFLRLHHCFFDESPVFHIFLASEMRTDGSVQVFVKMCGRPHVFGVDRESGQFSFQSPILDGTKGFYPVYLSDVARDSTSDAWILEAATLFNEEVRFERTFRFRNHIEYPRPSAPRPTPGHIPPPTSDSKKRRKAQRRLREVSLNSVRVQGTSDFERAAREEHPQLFRAHHDHNIGKTDILGKLYGHRKRSPDRPIANMMYDDWEETKPYVNTVRSVPCGFHVDSGAPPTSPSDRNFSLDENDSLFAFSPVRPRSFLSPERPERAPQKLHASTVFAPSAPKVPFEDLDTTKGRLRMRSSWHSLSPRPSTAVRHGTSVMESDIWSPRRRVAGIDRDSHGLVVVQGTPESLSTAEISPPQSTYIKDD